MPAMQNAYGQQPMYHQQIMTTTTTTTTTTMQTFQVYTPAPLYYYPQAVQTYAP